MNGKAAAPAFTLRGGEVIDGTGAPRRAADVRIRGGRIDAVLKPGGPSSGQVIDVSGCIVCPGFIDSHAHDDQLVLEPAVPQPKLAQGVSTVVTGNCGISLAPLVTDAPPPPLDILGRDVFRFERFADYLAELDRVLPGVNVVPLVGHTSLRVRHVAELDRTATAAEAARMRAEVVAALDAGAFGMSTGVYYPPARGATIDELHTVCGALKGRDAVLAMHIRDEGDQVVSAVEEALAVGSGCEARLVLSHHKVTGTANRGRSATTLGMIERAAASQNVCLDCYPYEASSTMLEPVKAARTGHVLITWSAAMPEMSGRTLQSIATQWGVSLEAAATRLLPGGAIYFSMAQEDVDRILGHPLTMIGSDGLPHDQRPHPRLWGSFPRVLGHYARDRKLFPLEAAVHKMTGLPASRFGLRDRGQVRAGLAADLVVFDPARVRDAATYEDPLAAPDGIEWVFVNGRMALHRSEVLNAHAGRRLRARA